MYYFSMVERSPSTFTVGFETGFSLSWHIAFIFYYVYVAASCFISCMRPFKSCGCMSIFCLFEVFVVARPNKREQKQHLVLNFIQMNLW